MRCAPGRELRIAVRGRDLMRAGTGKHAQHDFTQAWPKSFVYQWLLHSYSVHSAQKFASSQLLSLLLSITTGAYESKQHCMMTTDSSVQTVQPPRHQRHPQAASLNPEEPDSDVDLYRALCSVHPQAQSVLLLPVLRSACKASCFNGQLARLQGREVQGSHILI